MADALIFGGLRTPFVKSFTHYRGIATEDLMLASFKPLVERFNLHGQILGDVAFGAVIKSSLDWNLSRECVLKSGLHPFTPGYDVTRACGTSLETTNHLAMKIKTGQITIGVAGGVDTNSDVPVLLSRRLREKLLDLREAKSLFSRMGKALRISPTDFKPIFPGVMEPQTKLSMGEHTELMVKQWGITRKEQDELALRSHENGEKAYTERFYDDLVVPYHGLKKDPLLRGDTSVEKLGKLKPAFDRSAAGTLTAGNSSPLSDGSATVLIGNSEAGSRLGLQAQARFVDCEVAAVDFVHGDGLLMAPTIAVSRLIERNNMKLQDFDFYEIHEAFTGQVLCTLKAWQTESYCQKYMGRSALGSFPLEKMNVKGGSVALGHPFAATGARIVATLSKTLAGKKGARGLISICTAGGMGVAAILEGV